MIISNIPRYHSSDIKSKSMAAKPYKSVVSKKLQVDTYEASSGNEAVSQPAPAIRGDLIKTIKKRIGSGFYNSQDVLEDLSNSFAKALNQTL